MRRVPFLIAGFVITSGVPLVADADVSAELTVTTDYVFRGISQTMSGPALQGGVNIEDDSGWFANAWASNVDFTDVSALDDGARIELNLSAGYSRSLTNRLAAEFSANSYIFPGTDPGIEYDYLEWLGTLSVDDRHEVTIGFSNNVFNEDSDGIFYSAQTSVDLPRGLALCIEAGYYDLGDAYGFSYSYGQVAVAGATRSLDWQISYSTTSDKAAEIAYESTTSDRLVLTLTWSFGV